MDHVRQTDREDPASRRALKQYCDELARCFDDGFDISLSRDPEADALRPPLGGFFLAMSGNEPRGCVGLKGDGGPIGEIKRLWVAPVARRQGLARRLMTAATLQAKSLCMTTLRLDTKATLNEALAFYIREGWHEIPAFNDEPYAQHWFEKHL